MSSTQYEAIEQSETTDVDLVVDGSVAMLAGGEGGAVELMQEDTTTLTDIPLPIEQETPTPPKPSARRIDRPFADYRCKERLYAAAFLAVFVGIVVLEIVALHSYHDSRQTTILVYGSIAGCLFAVAVVCSWIFVNSRVLWVNQLSSVAFGVILGLTFLFGGSLLLSLVFFFLSVLASFWLFKTMRFNQLQFAQVMLEMVADLVKSNKSLLVVGAIVSVIQILWIWYWCLAAVEAENLTANSLAYMYLFLTLFWSTQVFQHIFHFVVCGTVAHWFFERSDNDERSKMTYKLFRRALGTSFGSICRGSLFVTIVAALWGSVRRIVGPTQNSTILCCFESVYLHVESWFHHYNKYAFTQVAVYGKDFRTAASDTWEMFFQRGVDSVIYTDRLDIMLLLPAFGGGAMVASLTAWRSLHLGLDNWVTISLISFWVAFCTVNLMTELIEACLASILTCFAEESNRLQDVNPILFHRLVRISEFGSFLRSPSIPDL